MAIVMSLSMTSLAYAADVNNETAFEEIATMEEQSPVDWNPVEPASVGSLLASCYGTITGGQGTMTVTLNSANWSTDIGVTISGNPNVEYYCTLTRVSDNKTYQLSSVYGNGTRVIAGTLGYAPAGQYRLYIAAWNMDQTPVRVTFSMYD